jgi:hypothetical protein
MSNNLNTNPILLDTFDTDFAIPGPLTIKKVKLFSAADGDVLSLLHGQADTANEGIRVNQNANLDNEIDFGRNGQPFPHGLFFDASAINSGLGSGDKVFIYLL